MAAPASGQGPSDDGVPIDADLIKVLASDTRRDILRLLGERRRTLTELAEALDLKKATVLEHLQKLTASELIRRMDDDQRLWVYYELAPRGKRILNPGRTTRFYLILGGSALAVVLVGAFVAAAMLGGVGQQASDDAAPDARAVLAEEANVAPPLVLWRGLDAGVPIPVTPAPEGSTLLIDEPSGQLALAVTDGRATLLAGDVDRLSEGRHAMRLLTSEGELPLSTTLDVRTPPIALAPLVVTEDATTTLILSAGAPGLPAPTDLVVRVDGTPVPLAEVGRDRALTVSPQEPGTIEVQVGRLATMNVRVVADLRVETLQDNGTLVLNLSDASGPLVGAAAALDGAPLGTSDENGTLRAAWPASGERALVIDAADGRTRAIALSVRETTITQAPSQLLLAAVDLGPASTRFAANIELSNLGPAPEAITLLARYGGQTIASALLDVAPGQTARARLAASVDITSPVTIDAFTAKAIVEGASYARDELDAENAAPGAAPTVAATTAPPPATATPAATAPAATALQTATRGANATGGLDLYYGLRPDATTTLYPTAMTTPATRDAMAQEPAVPFVHPALVLAIAAALAVILRRPKARER